MTGRSSGTTKVKMFKDCECGWMWSAEPEDVKDMLKELRTHASKSGHEDEGQYSFSADVSVA